MLELVQDDEVDDDWPFRSRGEPRLRPSAGSRLAAVRRAFYESAFAAIGTGREARVATYVRAVPGTDVEAAHALLAQYTQEQRWRVSRERFTDPPAGLPPGRRPALIGACRHAGSGYADGILVSDRTALPAADETYESYLRWLHDRFAFIAFLPPAYKGQRCDAP
ncbi:hypothetical protein [Streptomyces halstedii]|uniref:Recombinase family protein n=1 Tax=Streptomyces halstedii TaxID=1944 RepID=A0A6N9U8M6_STRHA|nr:hypothetical protein [Streptomyces halstedii]NEA20200.1 hypothetical protein [Streptomyces halstedii]